MPRLPPARPSGFFSPNEITPPPPAATLPANSNAPLLLANNIKALQAYLSRANLFQSHPDKQPVAAPPPLLSPASPRLAGCLSIPSSSPPKRYPISSPAFQTRIAGRGEAKLLLSMTWPAYRDRTRGEERLQRPEEFHPGLRSTGLTREKAILTRSNSSPPGGNLGGRGVRSREACLQCPALPLTPCDLGHIT